MKIKKYLDIIEKLPRNPYTKERVELPYLMENKFDFYNPTYDKIEFIQVSHTDSMGNIKYEWKMINNIDIDYKVDDIFIITSNNLIFTTLIDLTYTYKFKNWTSIDRNINSYYINFRDKFWALDDSRYEKFYRINDTKIMENIFIESLNEYTNGIPIIWED